MEVDKAKRIEAIHRRLLELAKNGWQGKVTIHFSHEGPCKVQEEVVYRLKKI